MAPYSWSCEAELSSRDDDSSIVYQNDRIMHVHARSDLNILD